MSWFKVDDGMLDELQWARALRDGGPAVLLLWARLVSWSSRQQTSSVIPGGLVGDVGKIGRSKPLRRALDALQRHGIVELLPDGSLRVHGARLDTEDARPRLRKAIGNGLRYRIFLRDGFACRYCGAKPDRAALVVDHVHPVSAGGTNDPDNLVTACEACNAGKGALILTEHG